MGGGGMLAGPASKENGRASDCSRHGLVAYGAGSSVVVVDVRSMQVLMALPMPSPGTTPYSPSPFVTALRWMPHPIHRDLTIDDSSTLHLRLAVGDRHGRIAIWDIGTADIITWLALDSDKAKLGIQDLAWVCGHPWLIMSIHGSSSILLWNTNPARPIWRYDASLDILGCITSDPFDARHVCAIGIKGSVLSINIGGLSEADVLVKWHQVALAEDRSGNSLAGSGKAGIASGERDQQGGKDAVGQTGGSSSTQVLALSLGNHVRGLFSPTARGILYITFPREIIAFDLQFGMSLSSAVLPRGFSKFLDLVTIIESDYLYCAHVDGKLSIWKRKGNKQAFSFYSMDTLLPSIGTPMPAPTVLSIIHCPLDIRLGKAVTVKEKESVPILQLNPSLPFGRFLTPEVSVAADQQAASSVSYACHETISETTLLSVSDDGRLWHWIINVEAPGIEVQDDSRLQNADECTSTSKNITAAKSNVGAVTEGLELRENGETEKLVAQLGKLESDPVIPIFKLTLTKELNLLPSTITTLAVPIPSLLATTPGGGNGPAVSVPLVALATQGGSIELIDAAANIVTASFMIHNSAVRGVRWLGNSRLVSFSYTEVKGKGGGFVNNLAVTCVRSGQNKWFRILQKPERAPMRALRTSPSGRYLLVLFREAPAEVWAMTKNPQMLRSLALPFTVMEWGLPPVPKPTLSSRASISSWRTPFSEREQPTIAATAAAVSAPQVGAPQSTNLNSGLHVDSSQDETAESFAFALVNGSLGVFELRGRRVRDFRPKWPSGSFVSADVLVTAMAYRVPHVVMGDRSGNIRWWDVTSGLSSMFNSHRGGVRRIKFAPVTLGDQSRGRVAVVFNDHTFAIYDLDTQDPVANAIVQPQFAGILVLELDWCPLRLEKDESFLLCVAGADSSFRLLEINIASSRKSSQGFQKKPMMWDRLRPMPLSSPALLPLPHALALRMLLQQGVQSSWFGNHMISVKSTCLAAEGGDLRHYLLDTPFPVLGDTVVAELLLKALEPYRKAGCLLDAERAGIYAALPSENCTARLAFSAAHFGDFEEAVFWLQLPRALALLAHESGGTQKRAPLVEKPGPDQSSKLNQLQSTCKESVSNSRKHMNYHLPGVFSGDLLKLSCRSSDVIPCDQEAVCAAARDQISWHETLGGQDAVQRRIHELITVGDFEAAVTVLLSTPPSSPHFYVDALRAVSLASAVSPALHELAVKVVAANMVATEDSLSGTHLLCAVGRYQEACSQLQDAGRWVDAATLAAAKLQGPDYARVLQRWADHVLYSEHHLWRAAILYVAAGALAEALAAFRRAQQPDTAVMFLLACHEAKALTQSKGTLLSQYGNISPVSDGQAGADLLDLPVNLSENKEEVRAVCEYYGQYQRQLAHLCTGLTPAL